jgi:hypothetical protein
VHNEISGTATNVVQIGSVYGDVTVRSPASQDQLDRAAVNLAEALREQWQLEAAVRSLHRPEPLSLRWPRTERAVAVDIGGTEVGDLDDLVDRFRTARRLVVLGDPGSGKSMSALLFALALLDDRKPGDQVPVLLAASSWDPRTEHLDAWIARRLETDYKALTNRGIYGPKAALRLVRSGRVFPVLDGLDELPVELHALAIEAIDHAAGGERSLVVTCRSQEYEAAVAADGAWVSTATVVELQPVDVDDAVRFLSAGPAVSAARWIPVFDQLRQRPDGPLTAALSTPLMVHRPYRVPEAGHGSDRATGGSTALGRSSTTFSTRSCRQRTTPIPPRRRPRHPPPCTTPRSRRNGG